MSDSTTPLKHCKKCSRDLPVSAEFWHTRRASKDGLAYICKECAIAKTHKWYADDPDRARTAKRAYYATHKQEHRAYRAAHADHYRSLKQTPKYKATAAEYRKTNKVKQSNRVYRSTHPELYAKATAEWRKANPTKSKAAMHRRIAHRKNIPGNFTDADLREMYLEQGGHCGYCGVGLCGDYWVEHIQPIARGGSSHPENILLVCAECNMNKGAKTVPEWEATRGW